MLNTFVVVGDSRGGRGRLAVLLLLAAFLLCQMGVRVMVTQARTVLVALSTDCKPTRTRKTLRECALINPRVDRLSEIRGDRC